MSLIDCKVKVDKKPDPKGDRVLLTFEYVPISRICNKWLTDAYNEVENSCHMLLGDCFGHRYQMCTSSLHKEQFCYSFY